MKQLMKLWENKVKWDAIWLNDGSLVTEYKKNWLAYKLKSI